MSAYAQRDLGYFSRRSSTLFLVVSLHAALFYGLVTTLAPHGTVVQTPFQTRLVDDALPREPPPALPKPQLTGTKIDAVKPEFDVASEPDPSRDVMIYNPEPSRPPPPLSPARVVKQVPGGPGAGFPNADDFYPDLARRMEEQGVATVRVCVDAKGRLTSDPTTLQGTGSSRLDEGALRLARAGSGHYRATTEDGQPVNSCYPFRIRFQLKN
jgi:TonB family protein